MNSELLIFLHDCSRRDVFSEDLADFSEEDRIQKREWPEKLKAEY
jgi:hypothetical protein